MGKEISIPISTQEVFLPGGKRFIVCQPQVNVVVEEAYAGSEIHKLEKPLRTLVGQIIWFPVAGSSADAYDKSTVCGVFATEIAEDGKELSRCPIAGVMMGDIGPSDVTISAGTSATAQFAPQVGYANFKKFDLRVKSGDPKKIFFSELKVGTQSIFLSSSPIPFDVMTREGAISSKIGFVPGIVFSITMVNLGEEPAIIEGNLVFEEIETPKEGPSPHKSVGN
jgi:hypothetical protein